MSEVFWERNPEWDEDRKTALQTLSTLALAEFVRRTYSNFAILNGISALAFLCLLLVNPSAAPQSPAVQSGAASSQIPGMTPNLFDVINVMAPPFNAKGDCKTDDHDAIYAALEAAYGASAPAAVYFPTPPHGCYLTSTLPFLGVTMTGNPRGLGIAIPGAGPTVIRGMPGQDIFQITDPNTTKPQVPHQSYTISNLYLVVDDSQDVSSSHLNRIPGRSVTDGAMSSGGKLLTSRHALWSLGDVGQAITVAGAGPSGTTLTTTIASVNSIGGASASTVTLAEPASTTVSDAAVYISLAGLAASARIGNCALAIDNSDGKSADWKVKFGAFGYPIWRDVTITTVAGNTRNSSCAIYLQGQWGTQYGATFDNVNILRTVYGFVIGDFTINPQLGSVGSDFLTLRKGLWQSSYPLITYDGGEDRLQEIQIGSAGGVGPQILQVASGVETGTEGWNIEIPEFELTTQGMRLEGQQQFVTNTTLAGGSTRAMTYWDASNSVCLNCSANGTLYVNGTGNQIQLTSGVDPNALLSVIDNGIGNVVTGQHADNPPDGDIPTRLTAIGTPFRGGPPVESRSNDFLLTGLSSAPYFNNYDLFLAPEDLGFTGGDHPSIVLDHSSFTGRYVALKSGGSTGCIALFNATTHPCKMEIGESLAGANVPAASVNVYVMAKCPAITSYTFAVRANRTIVNSGTFTCSTNYTVQSISANLSSHGGNDLGFAWSTGEVDIAYVAVVPYFGNLYSSRSEYWNIQPGLFAENKALGPVYYYVAPSAIVSVTARLSGPISCSDAPAVTIIDLGISPTTNFESAKVLKTLPTGTADGVFSATGFSAAIMGGHYVGLGFSAGTCATPPTIDVTITVQ